MQCLEGMNQMLQQGIMEYENQAGIEVPEDAIVRDPGAPPIFTDDDEWPRRIRYADPMQLQDAERNERAEFIVDMNGDVIKDRNDLPVPRKATQEEIDSCTLVKDPTTGIGYEEDTYCE